MKVKNFPTAVLLLWNIRMQRCSSLTLQSKHFSPTCDAFLPVLCRGEVKMFGVQTVVQDSECLITPGERDITQTPRLHVTSLVYGIWRGGPARMAEQLIGYQRLDQVGLPDPAIELPKQSSSLRLCLSVLPSYQRLCRQRYLQRVCLHMLWPQTTAVTVSAPVYQMLITPSPSVACLHPGEPEEVVSESSPPLWFTCHSFVCLSLLLLPIYETIWTYWRKYFISIKHKATCRMWSLTESDIFSFLRLSKNRNINNLRCSKHFDLKGTTLVSSRSLCGGQKYKWKGGNFTRRLSGLQQQDASSGFFSQPAPVHCRVSLTAYIFDFRCSDSSSCWFAESSQNSGSSKNTNISSRLQDPFREVSGKVCGILAKQATYFPFFCGHKV